MHPRRPFGAMASPALAVPAKGQVNVELGRRPAPLVGEDVGVASEIQVQA